MFKAFKQYFAKLSLISIGVLLITAPFVWLELSHPQQFHSITTIFAQYPTVFTVFRWLLIVLFIGGWPRFIQQYAKKYEWGAEKKEFWLAQRFRVSTWLIIFELFVCENILLTLIKAI